MNKYSNNINTNSEIDLRVLLIKVVNTLSKYLNLILVCVLAGIILSVAYYFVRKPVYESSMVISSGILGSANGHNLINTLQKLIEEDNNLTLSNLLGLSEDQVDKLKHISVTNVIEDEKDDDIITGRVFKIKVEISDNNILNDLENGLINYLENNPYVEKRISIKRKNIETLISKVKKEQESLDSIKKDITKNIAQSGQSDGIVVLDPVNVYKTGLDLFQRELDLKRELELIDNIQVIESFTIFEKPIRPNIENYMAVGIFMSLFVSVIIILLNEINIFLKKYKGKKRIEEIAY